MNTTDFTMSGKCNKCNTAVIFKEAKRANEVFGYPCDQCQQIICQNCCGLCITEIRAVQLQKRIVPFFCPGCLNSIKQILNLSSKVDQIVTELEDLRQNVSSLTEAVQDLQNLKPHVEKLNATVNSMNSRVAHLDKTVNTYQSSQLVETTDHNEMWQELQERQIKSKNIMLFNVPENGDDKSDIAAIFGVLCNNPPATVQFSRVGKKNSKGARALKITLNSHEDTLVLMRCRRKLKGKNIYLNLDLTRKQQEIDKRVWTEFRDRTSKGENDIQVKYIRGVPKIVDVREN